MRRGLIESIAASGLEVEWSGGSFSSVPSMVSTVVCHGFTPDELPAAGTPGADLIVVGSAEDSRLSGLGVAFVDELVGSDVLVAAIRCVQAGVRVGVERPPKDGATTDLSQLQVLCLKRLAVGDSVTDLARDVGFSRSALNELLRDLYSRLGVANRSQAIVTGVQQGLIP